MEDDNESEREAALQALLPKLTPEFLETFAQATEYLSWAVETNDAYRELCNLAGVKPRELKL